jgi:hypothetical protein
VFGVGSPLQSARVKHMVSTQCFLIGGKEISSCTAPHVVNKVLIWNLSGKRLLFIFGMSVDD